MSSTLHFGLVVVGFIITLCFFIQWSMKINGPVEHLLTLAGLLLFLFGFLSWATYHQKHTWILCVAWVSPVLYVLIYTSRPAVKSVLLRQKEARIQKADFQASVDQIRKDALDELETDLGLGQGQLMWETADQLSLRSREELLQWKEKVSILSQLRKG